MNRDRIKVARELLRMARELVAFKTGKVMLQVASELSGSQVTDMVQFAKNDKALFGKVDRCVKAIKETVEKYSKFGGSPDGDFTEWMWKRLETEYGGYVRQGKPVDAKFEKVHDAYALYLDCKNRDQVKQEIAEIRDGLKRNSLSTEEFIAKVGETAAKLKEECPNFTTKDDVEAAWKFLKRKRKMFSRNGYDVYKISKDDYGVLSDIATSPATEWCVAQKGHSGQVAFDDYGAPYWMVAHGDRPEALIHVKSEQFKDVDDNPYSDDGAVFGIMEQIFENHGYVAITPELVRKALEKLGLPATRKEVNRFYSILMRDYGGEDREIGCMVNSNEKAIERQIQFIATMDGFNEGSATKENLMDVIRSANTREEFDGILKSMDTGFADSDDLPDLEEDVYDLLFDKGLDAWKAIAQNHAGLPHWSMGIMLEQGDAKLAETICDNYGMNFQPDLVDVLEKRKRARALGALAKHVFFYDDGMYPRMLQSSEPAVLKRICDNAGDQDMTGYYDSCREQDLIEFGRRVDAESLEKFAAGMVDIIPHVGDGRYDGKALALVRLCRERGATGERLKKTLAKARRKCETDASAQTVQRLEEAAFGQP